MSTLHTRTAVVNGQSRIIEEKADGAWIEVIERDESGSVVAWYRRKAAPDAAVPMTPSPHYVITYNPHRIETTASIAIPGLSGSSDTGNTEGGKR